MVLSENWKRLEGFFLLKFHHFYEIAEINFFENFPPAVFNILKDPLLVQKQMIPQKKDLMLSFFQLKSLRAVHNQEDSTQKDIEKKGKFDGANSGRKKNVPILFLHY